jgi:hypothetical protein
VEHAVSDRSENRGVLSTWVSRWLPQVAEAAGAFAQALGIASGAVGRSAEWLRGMKLVP